MSLPQPTVQRVRVRSRWDDCDRHGHVNNAAYLAIVRAAHDLAGMPSGELLLIDISYRSPIDADTDVDVRLEVVDLTAGRWRISYELSVQGRRSARAVALWQVGGERQTLPLPELQHDVRGLPFRYHHAVRSYELGPGGAGRPQALLQWMEHAVFRAAVHGGWPRARMESAGFVTLIIGHQLVLGDPALEDERVEISSRLIELRRVSGIWHHEVRREDGALIAADRARGAFMDLDGRIRPAPREMLDALMRGEPAP